MSMTVQSASGPEWSRRDWSPTRAPAERMDVAHDKWSAASRETAANPYDQAIDALRTAALRRDAALASTSHIAKAVDTTADAAIAAGPPRDAGPASPVRKVA
jgi:hypothetical protein